LLNSARLVWSFFHQHVPNDLVPFYDLTDPRIPNVPRDSSAAALGAAGLYLLSQVDLEHAAEHRQACEAIVASLVDGYLTSDGRLLHGCFDLPRGVAIDNELIWGSYYLMEILDWLAPRAA
jgi:unsaturated chondroitin disaccharide hydrolase